MLRFLLGRAGSLGLVLLGSSIVIFLVMRVLPGDPASVLLGSSATAETVRALRAQFNLDAPLPLQYLRWAGAALGGDFGRSFLFSTDVTALLAQRFPVTLHLSLMALLIALVIAIPAGVVAARNQGGWPDHLCRLVTLAGISVPVFWQGLLMILLFSVVLRWLPPGGYVPLREGFWSSTAHILMPAVALGTAYASTVARMLRASMLDVLGRDYITVARALGVPEWRVVWNDALRNALIPTLTAAGFSFGYLLAGAVLTEIIFNLPGMGRLLFDSIMARDYPLVQALVMLNVLAFILINLAMDLLYALLDPRVRA